MSDIVVRRCSVFMFKFSRFRYDWENDVLSFPIRMSLMFIYVWLLLVLQGGDWIQS